MVEAVKNNLDRIIETCKQMQVRSLYLVGSGARVTDFNRESDLDFTFRFIDDKSGMPIDSYDYFDLLFKLEEITGRKVDLIAEERIRNKYFLKRIVNDRIKIYEA